MTRSSTLPVRVPVFLSRDDIELLRWLSRTYVRRHVLLLVLATACTAASALATAGLAWLAKPMMDGVIQTGDDTLFYLVPLGVLAAVTVNGAALYGQMTLTQLASLRIVVDLRSAIAAHLVRADAAHLSKFNPGDLIARCMNDADLVQGNLTNAVFNLLRDGLTFLVLAGVMVSQDWRLSLATLIVLPGVGFGIGRIGRRARMLASGMMQTTGNLITRLSEVFEASRLVKLSGTEQYEAGRVRKAAEDTAAFTMKLARNRALSAPVNEILGGLAIALTILYGGWSVARGDLTSGSLASFLTALALSYRPLKRLTGVNAALQEGLAAGHRVRGLLQIQPTIVDRPDAKPLPAGGGAIRFEKVSFSYDGTTPVLDNVDLEVGEGSTVALVGLSGAGKSTTVNLIPRLYDVTGGRITIAGHDIRDVTLASLRASIAVVSQENVIFDATVRENIAYGRPDASDEAVRSAAHAAGADGFIMALPQGYDTPVGARGHRLSGGQRQRLAIARAILKNAPILLLDEATSSLDQQTEASIKEALARLMKGRTTLIVAHRLSTIIDADEIVVLDAGRVVERGRHAELLARGDLYARLYTRQAATTPPSGQARGTPSLVVSR